MTKATGEAGGSKKSRGHSGYRAFCRSLFLLEEAIQLSLNEFALLFLPVILAAGSIIHAHRYVFPQAVAERAVFHTWSQMRTTIHIRGTCTVCSVSCFQPRRTYDAIDVTGMHNF